MAPSSKSCRRRIGWSHLDIETLVWTVDRLPALAIEQSPEVSALRITLRRGDVSPVCHHRFSPQPGCTLPAWPGPLRWPPTPGATHLEEG
jgi:hypothetical protein